jgi:hypothetical protein
MRYDTSFTLTGLNPKSLNELIKSPFGQSIKNYSEIKLV